MDKLKAVYLALLSLTALVVFMFLAVATIHERENPLDAYAWIEYGPFRFRMLEALLLTLIALPTFFFCGVRTVQLLTGKFNHWPGVRPLATEFGIIGTVVTVYMVTTVADWETASRTSLTPMLQGREPQVAPGLTDERLEYPSLPLEPPNVYAGTLRSLSGDAVPMSDFRGKPLFLNYWATWCSPCRAEMPSIQKLYDMLQSEGISFALVSTEEPETVKAWLEQEGYTFPVYTVEEELPPPLQIQAYPTTYILTPEGEVAFAHRGSTAWDGEKTLTFLRALRAD